MIRAVLDCNIFISALLSPKGPPARVVRALAEGAFEVVVSSAILVELRRSAGYAKVIRLTGMSEMDINLWATAIEALAVHVEPSIVLPAFPDDPSDDIYIAAALEGRAEFLVTGDSHILRVGEYQSVAMVTAREFLKVLERS